MKFGLQQFHLHELPVQMTAGVALDSRKVYIFLKKQNLPKFKNTHDIKMISGKIHWHKILLQHRLP